MECLLLNILRFGLSLFNKSRGLVFLQSVQFNKMYIRYTTKNKTILPVKISPLTNSGDDMFHWTGICAPVNG